LNQVYLHSFGIAQPRQSAAKQYPIKTREHSLYIFFEFTDKLLHGVSPLVGLRILEHLTTYTFGEAPKLFAACRYAGQVGNQVGILRRVGNRPLASGCKCK
jgi:hypothetical protein